MRVGVRPFATDPGEARPAPDDAEVRFAVAVQSASAREAQREGCRSGVRFADHVNAAAQGVVAWFGILVGLLTRAQLVLWYS